MRLLAPIIALGLLMSGCAGDPGEAAVTDSSASASASTAAQASASAEAEAKAQAEAEAREAERKAAEHKEWQQCVSATEELHEALRQVDSRLNVGLNVGELSDRLGDVSVAYDSLDFEAMEAKCTLNVGIALEDALNQYIKSLNRWERCVDDFGCSVEGAVLKKLRRHWREAGERLEHVSEVLESPDSYADATDFPSEF